MLYGKPYGAVLTILKDLVEDGKVIPIVDGVYRWSKKEFCAFVDQSLGLKSNFQLAPVIR